MAGSGDGREPRSRRGKNGCHPLKKIHLNQQPDEMNASFSPAGITPAHTGSSQPGRPKAPAADAASPPPSHPPALQSEPEMSTMNLNIRTLIATALISFAAAGSVNALASEADSLPMPSWNPEQTVYGSPIGLSQAPAAMTRFEARMSATGSGHELCAARVALNPNAGRNASLQAC
ncbi:MAG TPA: hypothetical protein PK403_10805 [Plasticicumulans sp.]|nr:hypothetical protein [Plasticicumulans sp.]